LAVGRNRGLIRAALVALLLAGATMTPAADQTPTTHTVITFDDLDGWPNDDHQAALEVFQSTCGDLKGAEWKSVCALAKSNPAARTFFELFFIRLFFI